MSTKKGFRIDPTNVDYLVDYKSNLDDPLKVRLFKILHFSTTNNWSLRALRILKDIKW